MAGKQKPNIENLGKEMTNYKIISYKLIENTTAQGLFDENLSSDADWTTKRIAYWGAEGSVVISLIDRVLSGEMQVTIIRVIVDYSESIKMV